jgi:hypothetical protein
MAPDHCTIFIQSHGHVTAVYSNSSRPSTAALIKSATQRRIFDSTDQHCVTCLSSQGHVTAVYIYKPSNSEALLVFKSSTQHRTFESADHCTAYIPSYGQDTAVFSYRPSVAGILLVKSSTQHRTFESADHCTAYIPSYGQDTAVFSYRPSVAGILLVKSSTQHRIFQSTALVHAVIIPHLAASHSPLILPPALHSTGAREQHTALTGLFLYRLIGPFILFHHYRHRSTDWKHSQNFSVCTLSPSRHNNCSIFSHGSSYSSDITGDGSPDPLLEATRLESMFLPEPSPWTPIDEILRSHFVEQYTLQPTCTTLINSALNTCRITTMTHSGEHRIYYMTPHHTWVIRTQLTAAQTVRQCGPGPHRLLLIRLQQIFYFQNSKHTK